MTPVFRQSLVGMRVAQKGVFVDQGAKQMPLNS